MARALTATALLATAALLALAGCGGGGDDTTAATDTVQQREETTATTDSSTRPDPRPGSKAAAAGVPTSKQADNSIQTWGVEASEAEREEAIADVQGYLDARAARSWKVACSHLAAEQRAEYTQIGNGSCTSGIDLFTEQAPDRALQEEAEIEVLSFRSGGGFGFLIYERRDDGKVYATAVKPEEGEWKIVSVTPNPIS